MVDRIPGYLSGVVAPTRPRRSRPVAGEAMNERLLPRQEKDGGKQDSQSGGRFARAKDPDFDADSVEVDISTLKSLNWLTWYG